MRLMRKAVLIGSAIVMMSCAMLASGQGYPDKSVRMISTEAGGFLDILARMIAQELTPALGQSVVVENRPSVLTPELLAKAAPDGYTISIGSSTVWITPLIQKTSYDGIKDFSPITLAVTYPYILVVNPSVPVKSVKELVDLAKAKPGVLNIGGVASPGGASFLAAELFKAGAGINLVRVPYNGNASALVAVLAGDTQMMFNDLGSVTPQIKAGKLKALAVSSLTPFPAAPDLPTMAASGVPGFEVIAIAGVLAPAKTPVPIIARLNKEILAALNKPQVKDKLANTGTGAQIVGSSPEEFGAKIKSEIVKWGQVLKDAGVKPET